MNKEEFIARYHPNTRSVFKNKAQNTDLRERLEAASKDKSFSKREREKVQSVLHDAEQRGVFAKKLEVDRKEGKRVEKELEKGFKQAFASGVLKEPSRSDVMRAMGK